MAKKKKSKAKTKKAKKRKVQKGMAMILATFNNTLITLTDEEGNVLVQSSPAVVGYGGARRSTAFAATRAAQDAAEKAIKKYRLKEVKVFLKGPGSGRNAAVKGLDSAGLRITQLADRTPLPHNGCMPRKAPRN
jgi:small subunit ribosomal protein S11